MRHITHTLSAFPRSFRFDRPFGIMAPLYDADPNPPAPPAPPVPPPAPEPKTLTITEEEFENRINGRIAQAQKKWEKDHGQPMTAEERTELEQARKDREAAKRKSLEDKGRYEEALKTQADSIHKEYEPKVKERDEKIGGLSDRLRREIVTNKLLAAASAGNAYNAEQAVRLTEPYIKLDDDFEPMVVDEKGKQRFVGAEPMTPAQLMDEFLKANPHLVKAQAGGGGGAGGGAHAKGQEPGELATLEAAVVAAEKKYKETRSTTALTEHREAVKLLNEAKRKKAA